MHSHSRKGHRTAVLFLKCGHVANRLRDDNRMWTKIHCGMCEYLNRERDVVNVRRAAKKVKRAKRLARLNAKITVRVEAGRMAKKQKAAPAKVAKKADVKKKTVAKKEKKSGRTKKGRGWYMPSFFASPDGVDNFVTAGNEILEKTVAAFRDADDNVVYENELVGILEKAGVKAQGKKTVKKLVKGILRNLSRAGVIGKERDRRREEKEAKKLAKKTGGKADTKKKDDDEDDDDDEEEVVDETPKKSVLKKKK